MYSVRCTFRSLYTGYIIVVVLLFCHTFTQPTVFGSTGLKACFFSCSNSSQVSAPHNPLPWPTSPPYTEGKLCFMPWMVHFYASHDHRALNLWTWGQLLSTLKHVFWVVESRVHFFFLSLVALKYIFKMYSLVIYHSKLDILRPAGLSHQKHKFNTAKNKDCKEREHWVLLCTCTTHMTVSWNSAPYSDKLISSVVQVHLHYTLKKYIVY